MSDEQDDERVGYGKPPKHTRWKAGQSVNSKRQYPKRSISDAELIDRELLKRVDITVEGKRLRVTKLETILFHLWKKELGGDPRALRIRRKFLELARQYIKPRTETVFVDNEYTKAFAAIPLKDKEKLDE